ncbi:UNKNOWN [Stylonychia lemnae]|uniref:Uncharacterized protein n=1 Tax=Stylonychia lemnae TaxID=5949 RepID=A0A078AFR2_STYLE|nr:UNKNOWN [Stylonychia lemnae]|eukprot:CDW80332.1 UNKNOWN [Stylonychia lemnae]
MHSHLFNIYKVQGQNSYYLSGSSDKINQIDIYCPSFKLVLGNIKIQSLVITAKEIEVHAKIETQYLKLTSEFDQILIKKPSEITTKTLVVDGASLLNEGLISLQALYCGEIINKNRLSIEELDKTMDIGRVEAHKIQNEGQLEIKSITYLCEIKHILNEGTLNILNSNLQSIQITNSNDMMISRSDLISRNLLNQEGSKLLVDDISSLKIMESFINKGLAQSSQGDTWVINDFLNESDFVTEHGFYTIQDLKNTGTITLLGSTWNLSKVITRSTQPDFVPIQSFRQEGKIECSDDIIINDEAMPMGLRTLKNVEDYRWRDLCITPEQINQTINNIEYGGSYIVYAKRVEIPLGITFETQRSIVLEVQEFANYGQWVLFRNLNLRLVKMINGLDNDRQATLQVNGKLTIDAQTIDNRFGVIASNDTLSIKSEALLNGALMHQWRAPLFPNGNINSSSGACRYQEGAYQHCYLNGSGIISSSDLGIECKQIKNEYGEIMTQGNLTIQGDMLYNLCGNVYGSKSINANVKEIKLDRAEQRIFPAIGGGHYHNLRYRLECSDPPTLSSLGDINLVFEQLINHLGVVSAGQNIKLNNREYSGISSGVINHSRTQWYDENNYVTGEYHRHDHRVPATNSVIVSGSKIEIASSLFAFEGGTAAAPVIKIKAQNIIVNQNRFNSHVDRDQEIVINLYEAAKSMTGGLIKENLATGVIQCPHIKSKSSLDLDKLNIQT